MLFEVFSSDLDQNKTWYVLTTTLCGTTPSKFFNSDLFKVFKDEVSVCDVKDLNSEDGRSVAAKLHDVGIKIVQNKVYVGTFFSIFAGNLRRRNLLEAEFLTSGEFLAVKDRMNRRQVSPPLQPWHSTPAKTLHFDDSLDDKENTPKLLNGNEQSYYKKRKRAIKADICGTSTGIVNVSGSSSSSCDSGLSLRDIDEHNYNPNYKKRKIKQKCQTIMDDVNDVCSRGGEDLETVLARSCLQSGDLGDESKDIVRKVFNKVEESLGTTLTLQELVPENIIQNQVHSMTVPDWQLLLAKLQIPMSDDGWQKLLNLTEMGKNGVSNIIFITLAVKIYTYVCVCVCVHIYIHI